MQRALHRRWRLPSNPATRLEGPTPEEALVLMKELVVYNSREGSDHLLHFLLFRNLFCCGPLLLGVSPRVLLKINAAVNSGAIGILPSGSSRWELGGSQMEGLGPRLAVPGVAGPLWPGLSCV